MADKKITDLTELTTADQSDLLVVVASPASTAITKKIRASSLFGNVIFTTTATACSPAIRSTITSNVALTTSNTVTAGRFDATATATSTNTAFQYGIMVTSTLGAGTANVKSEHTAAKFKLDVGNAGSLIVNTYGLIVRVANTADRVAQPQAFISFAEDTANTSYSTKYLFDIGQDGTSNVQSVATMANTGFLFSNSTATAATHKLRVRINGADYFILLASNAASYGIAV